MNKKQPDSRRSIIYLMRHGDSRQDEIKRFIGHTDTPLNETGRKQAAWWREQLSAFFFNRIYCSDLSRSVETAEIIAGNRQETMRPLPELREINLGQWDGLPMQEVRCRYPEEFEKRGADLVHYRPDGGESFFDLSARVLPAFELITRDVENERVLIVGHAGVNRIILCHLLGMSPASLFRLCQDYCCLNIIVSEMDCVCLRSINIPPGNIMATLI
jgi:probable phosphoglycerate mutase